VFQKYGHEKVLLYIVYQIFILVFFFKSGLFLWLVFIISHSEDKLFEGKVMKFYIFLLVIE